LIPLSSFFANIESTFHNQKDDDTVIETIITLPSATSKGLALALTVLQKSILGDPIELSNDKDAAVLIEALSVTKAYDLPIITSLILRQAVVQFDDEPFVLYAVAVIAGDEPTAVHASRLTLPFDIDLFLPDKLGRILQEHNLYALSRLGDLHHNRKRGFEKFKQLLLRYQAVPDGERFTKACSKGKGCEAFEMFKGDFGDLRQRTGEAFYEVFVAMSGVDARTVLTSMIKGIVQCEKCAGRISKCFAHALWTFEKKAKSTI